MHTAMTIAGSDSGGGAGIQADLKTFEARGVFGTSAITALTAQNTTGVQGIFEVPPDFVALQITSVLTDIGADAVKTGMLASSDIIRAVAAQLEAFDVTRLVVDPVMVAKSGDALLAAEARDALIEHILPRALVVTPNLHEAGVLVDGEVRTLEDMRQAAQDIYALGPANVVIKGGHLPDETESIDLLYDGAGFIDYRATRIDSTDTHGTGCTFASAIAAELAKGADVPAAVRTAKDFITGAIRAGRELDIGSGHGPVHHFWQHAEAV